MDHTISPYGGTLCELLVSDQEAQELRAASRDFPSIALRERQLCDLELLMDGSFSPLRGFMDEADYTGVLEKMRLAYGTLWSMPIMLDVSADEAKGLQAGTALALREPEGTMLAVLTVSAVFDFDWKREAQAVFGTNDLAHPAVRVLHGLQGRKYVGGRVQGIQLPIHYDYRELRFTPRELRAAFTATGWRGVTAFQTRNPLHRAHKEMTERAATQANTHLLLNPVVGMTKPGDIDHYTRVRCYLAIANHYPQGLMKVSLLNLAMRMGGPREALWHAAIRRNLGCTHLVIGRDHAGPGPGSDGKPFYGPYDAQELFKQHESELGIQMVPFQEMVYNADRAQYMPRDEVDSNEQVLSISGTEQRRRLREGLEIPDWFSYTDVVDELRRSHPPKDKQGLCLFFTGLSGSGKSTIAQVLLARFLEIGGRPVTLLDGDIVRRNLSQNLGFSKEDRDSNILRIGFVANEISKNGGVAICAPIAPYADARRQVRELVSERGAFIEIHVSTPLEVCEQRDRKGLYAKARAGIIKGFTGIDDPYETPEASEISIDTSNISPEQAAQDVLLYLDREGYLAGR